MKILSTENYDKMSEAAFSFVKEIITETPDAVLCTVVGNQLYYATMSELCRAQIR